MIFHYIDHQKKGILTTYQELHACPELSEQEERTSTYLQNRLRNAGFEVHTFPGHYGFMVELKGDSSEVIAVRADMDAVVHDLEGSMQPLHTCGHDAHSTIVLYVALALAQSKRISKKTIRFLFQPAEEIGRGALQMIESGALERVTKLFGIHLRPQVEVPDGMASPVVLHGGSVTLKGRIRGQQAHAARPQLGRNVLETGAAIIQALQGIRLQKEKTYSVKMTHLQAGNAQSSNVIPGEGVFTLDLRSTTNAGLEELRQLTLHVVQSVADLTQTQVACEWLGHTPAAVPNEAMISMAKRAIIQVLGEGGLSGPCETQGAEDFHFYSERMPHLEATMIGLGCGLEPGLHHPQMKFQPNALISGIKILTALVLDASGTEISLKEDLY